VAHTHHREAHAHGQSSSPGEPPTTIEDLTAELRRRGQRVTTARRAVLEQLLRAGDTHLSADELATAVRAQHPEIHLSTIYRTLDALDEAGLIARAPFDEQSTSYHLTDDVHHHAVCGSCGRTLSLPPELLEPLTRSLLADYGFHADPRHLTIDGRCDRCAAG
jgi:Fur family ferric uptake transcriptional regulator